MSNLQELIERYCPDGVEYKVLCDVASFGGGHTPSKAVSSNYEADGIWWVTSKDVKTRTLTQTGITLSESGAADLTLYPAGTLVMVTRSGILKRMLPVAILDCPMTVNQDIKAIMPDDAKILPRYLLHVLVAEDETIRQRYGKVGGTVDSVNFNLVKKHRIPVPPIEVQCEIVRLLDAYTAAYDALIGRLNEEIELQAKSLAAYRESLLTFSERERERVRWATLGELGVFMRGSSFQKKHFVDDGVPCIHYGQVHTQFDLSTDHVVSYLDTDFATKMKRAQPGDLIIATTSEDDEAVGKAIAWVGDTDVVISNDAYIYRHSLDPVYMAHVFKSDLYQQPKLKNVTGTKVRRVHERNLSKIPIPVPSRAEQQEIVRLLDAFTKANSSLESELRTEIAFRETQLNEFRNQLLTFPEKVA